MSIIGDGIVLGAGGESASIFVTGLSETDTVTATNGSKTKAGVWTQKPNPASVVPDGYTQLEYIQNTGTQYIDTGILLNPLNGFEIDCKFSTLTSGVRQLMFGSYRNGNEESINVEITAADELRYYAKGDVGSYAKVSTGEIYNVHVEYNNSTKLLSFSSELGSASATKSYTKAFTSQMRLFLDNRDNPTETFGSEKIRMYQYSVSVGGTYIQNLIPCKRNSDNTIGMYDLVSNTFFGNSGTGTFTAGAEVPQTIDGFLIDKIKSYGTWTITATDGTNTATQDVLVDVANTFQVEIRYSRLPAGYTEVEFIRSSGQQYLELDYFANTKSVLEIDFIINSVSYSDGWCQLLGSESNGNFSCWLKSTPGFNFYTVGGNYLHSISFVGNKYKLIFGNGSIVLNGSTIYTYTASSFTSGASVVINGIRGYLGGSYPYPSMTIYPFNFKEDDVVVAEYIPCVRDSDNVTGVFNVVSKTFISGSGGSYTAGDPV